MLYSARPLRFVLLEDAAVHLFGDKGARVPAAIFGSSAGYFVHLVIAGFILLRYVESGCRIFAVIMREAL